MQINKDTRTACAEERRKLRELQEEERELKKQHREELAAPAANGAKDASAADSKDKEKGGSDRVASSGAAKNGEAKGSKGPGAAAPSARRRQMDAAEKAMATRVTKAKAACEDAVSRLESKLEQVMRRNGTRCVEPPLSIHFHAPHACTVAQISPDQSHHCT